MEPNIAGISKKIWNTVRVAIYMIKKGLCKRKIFMDLNMMMKRGKIAGKTLRKNLMFNHHHKNDEFVSQVGLTTPFHSPDEDPPQEFEFSCNNTPLHHHYFTTKRKIRFQHKTTLDDNKNNNGEDNNVNLEDVNNVLEMMLRNEEATTSVSAQSPVLGLGLSPRVRQLRITDSPFPVLNAEEDNNNNKEVDQDAEAFINKFYSQLKQQKYY